MRKLLLYFSLLLMPQIIGGGSNATWATLPLSGTNTGTGMVLAPTATGTTPLTIGCPNTLTVNCLTIFVAGKTFSIDSSGTFTLPNNFNVAGNVVVNGSITSAGNPVAALLRGTVSITGTALVAGACDSNALTLTGAALSGTFSNVVVNSQGSVGAGFYEKARVSAANTVLVEVCAAVAGTPTTQTFNVAVF